MAAVCAVAVFAAALSLLLAPAASACSCVEMSREEQVAELIHRVHREPGHLLFVGTPGQLVQTSEYESQQTYTVDELVAGAYASDFIDVRDAADGCTGDVLPDRVGAEPVHVSQRDGDWWRVRSCGGPAGGFDMALLSQTRGREPPATSSDAAEFIVSPQLGSELLALLDSSGAPVAYGAGLGMVNRIAPCPGNEYAIVVVSPSPFEPETVGDPWRIELRRVQDLSLVDQIPLPGTEDTPRLSLEVEGLSCHDPLGAFTTYLLTTTGDAPDRSVPRAIAESQIHVVRDGQIHIIAAGLAVSIAVDSAHNLAYTVDGTHRITEWQLDTAETTTHAIERDWSAWHIDIIDGAVRVLVDDSEYRSQFDSRRSISIAGVGPIDDLRALDFGVGGVVLDVAKDRDATYFLIGDRVVRIGADNTFDVYRDLGVSAGRLAAGSEGIILGRSPGIEETHFGAFPDNNRFEHLPLSPLVSIGPVHALASLTATIDEPASEQARSATTPRWTIDTTNAGPSAGPAANGGWGLTGWLMLVASAAAGAIATLLLIGRRGAAPA